MVLAHIFYGFMAVALGVASMKYNYQLVGFTGNVDFFERFLGPGGSYFGFKLLSMILIIGGLLYMTGLGDAVLNIVLSPLSSLFPKSN
jgi:hypothetical protein